MKRKKKRKLKYYQVGGSPGYAGITNAIKRKLYNVIPSWTGDEYSKSELPERLYSTRNQQKPVNNKFIDDSFFAHYMEQPYDTNYLQTSLYKPQVASNKNANYKRLNPKYMNKQALLNKYFESDSTNQGKAHVTVPSSFYDTKNAVNSMDEFGDVYDEYRDSTTIVDPLRNVKLSKGKDKAGDYISLWDTYNIKSNPVEGFIGKPYEIYDRMYFDPKTKKAKQQGGIITDPQGQYNHPGKVTRIPSNTITMKNIPYPMYAKPNKGPGQMMYPNQNYTFPMADSVTEYPLMMAGKQAVNKAMMEEGGSTRKQFPDELTFPEQRKNDFLKFLRETSFDKIKDQFGNEQRQYDDYMKKGGGFKINPAHKGWCTPMTKSTCTGKRRQFAINAKNHFKKQQDGGEYDYQQGGPYSQWWDYIPNTGHGLYTQKNVPQAPQGMQSPYQGYDPYQWNPLEASTAPQAPQLPQTMMDPNQVPPPVTTPPNPQQQGPPNWKDRWWANPDLMNAGMESATNILNYFNRKKKEKDLRRRTSADQWNIAGVGNRGDYTTNQGYFKPDQHTPIQFPGQAGFSKYGGQYQEGGEVYMDDAEIENFLKNGGQLTYLD